MVTIAIAALIFGVSSPEYCSSEAPDSKEVYSSGEFAVGEDGPTEASAGLVALLSTALDVGPSSRGSASEQNDTDW